MMTNLIGAGKLDFLKEGVDVDRISTIWLKNLNKFQFLILLGSSQPLTSTRSPKKVSWPFWELEDDKELWTRVSDLSD